MYVCIVVNDEMFYTLFDLLLRFGKVSFKNVDYFVSILNICHDIPLTFMRCFSVVLLLTRAQRVNTQYAMTSKRESLKIVC